MFLFSWEKGKRLPFVELRVEFFFITTQYRPEPPGSAAPRGHSAATPRHECHGRGGGPPCPHTGPDSGYRSQPPALQPTCYNALVRKQNAKSFLFYFSSNHSLPRPRRRAAPSRSHCTRSIGLMSFRASAAAPPRRPRSLRNAQTSAVRLPHVDRRAPHAAYRMEDGGRATPLGAQCRFTSPAPYRLMRLGVRHCRDCNASLKAGPKKKKRTPPLRPFWQPRHIRRAVRSRSRRAEPSTCIAGCSVWCLSIELSIVGAVHRSLSFARMANWKR